MAKKAEKFDGKKRKIRFPIARIKRIMQSDEDIGKVSTSAPVVLSKAIELFMKELLEEVAKVSKNTRITYDDLKVVILNDIRFDFLKVLVSNE